MKRVVWKYVLRLGESKVFMPASAKIINYGVQDSRPVIWAMVNREEQELKPVRFIVVYTGEEINTMVVFYTYLGTHQNNNGIVTHCFYLKEK